MEEGEEFFYMRKGDMTLKIVEGGQPKDVHIKEGQVFLLPAKIPHSPNRGANTVEINDNIFKLYRSHFQIQWLIVQLIHFSYLLSGWISN